MNAGNIPSLVRWEWFKLLRRWMLWILLIILLLISQLVVWGEYFSYRRLESRPEQVSLGGVTMTCDQLLARLRGTLPADTDPRVVQQLEQQARQQCDRVADQRQQELQRERDGFTLPRSIPRSLGVAEQIAVLLVAILSASTIGNEYNWGTLRNALSRGVGRWQFLAAKLITLLSATVAGLLLTIPFTIASSLGAAALTGSSNWGALEPQLFGQAALDVGRTWFALSPYIALAAMITVVTRSGAVGIGVGIAYGIGEQIISAILISSFDWFTHVAQYLLGVNNAAWLLAMTQSRGDHEGLRAALAGQFPSEWHAFTVLAVYTAVLVGIAFWQFQRRDVTGTQ